MIELPPDATAVSKQAAVLEAAGVPSSRSDSKLVMITAGAPFLASESKEVLKDESASSSEAAADRSSGSGSSGNITGVHKKAAGETRAPAKSEKQHGRLIPGNAAYHIPPSMVENQSSPVDLWIDASLSVEEIKKQLESFLKDNANKAATSSGQSVVKSKSISSTQIVGKEVLIGKKMYAELTGPDFEIQPSGVREQAYIEGRPLRWSWFVKPKRAGKEGLPLEIKVMADPGEGQTPVETIREVVIVQARARSLREIIEALDWWIKLLGGGGVGAVLLLAFNWFFPRRFKKR